MSTLVNARRAAHYAGAEVTLLEQVRVAIAEAGAANDTVLADWKRREAVRLNERAEVLRAARGGR